MQKLQEIVSKIKLGQIDKPSLLHLNLTFLASQETVFKQGIKRQRVIATLMFSVDTDSDQAYALEDVANAIIEDCEYNGYDTWVRVRNDDHIANYYGDHVVEISLHGIDFKQLLDVLTFFSYDSESMIQSTDKSLHVYGPNGWSTTVYVYPSIAEPLVLNRLKQLVDSPKKG